MNDEERDLNNGGNEPTEQSQTMKVENEEVKVFYEKPEDGEEKITKIEYPKERKDDKEWQEKAKKSISITALKNKENLERKKIAETIKQQTKDLKEATETLLNLGKTEDQPKINIKDELTKELGLESPDELVTADPDEYNKAFDKISQKFQKQIYNSTSQKKVTEDLIQKITEENEPHEIKDFTDFVKNLGVDRLSEKLYNTWKGKHKKSVDTSTKFANSQNKIDDIPFVPEGEHNLDTKSRIYSHNQDFLLKNIRKV